MLNRNVYGGCLIWPTLPLDNILLLYKAMVRLHLEYASSVWFLYKKGDIEIIEKVQKRATKLIISLKHLLYTERL